MGRGWGSRWMKRWWRNFVSSNPTCQLGSFRLEFEPGGKLAQIMLDGGVELLHRASYEFDLKDGRMFRVGGWDECFPSIEPFEETPVMGELIGTAPTIVAGGKEIVQTWERPGYIAARRFCAVGDRALEMTFTVRNRDERPLRFVWASHALFATKNLHSVDFGK